MRKEESMKTFTSDIQHSSVDDHPTKLPLFKRVVWSFGKKIAAWRGNVWEVNNRSSYTEDGWHVAKSEFLLAIDVSNRAGWNGSLTAEGIRMSDACRQIWNCNELVAEQHWWPIYEALASLIGNKAAEDWRCGKRSYASAAQRIRRALENRNARSAA